MIFRSKAILWPSVRSLHFLMVPGRKTIRVAGPESAEFLQGLVTNDIGHIAPDSATHSGDDEGASADVPSLLGVPRRSLYSMLLNHAGRIVFDTIIFRGRNAQDEFYLECDAEQAAKLVRHLKLYRVRKKVEIEAMEQTRTAVLFNSWEEDDRATPTAQLEEPGSVFCNQKEDSVAGGDLVEIAVDGVLHSSDPRVPALGHRILASEVQMPSVCAAVGASRCDDPTAFEHLRHRLGVCEGPLEMPAGKCFPLEYNADYMHGVSFHKGCYVGQELTARTHHTGIVRKRIMPVRLLSDQARDVNLECDVMNGEGKKVGRIRAWNGRSGLGLMRVSESLSAENLLLGDANVAVSKPFWWPKEAPKKNAKKKDEE